MKIKLELALPEVSFNFDYFKLKTYQYRLADKGYCEYVRFVGDLVLVHTFTGQIYLKQLTKFRCSDSPLFSQDSTLLKLEISFPLGYPCLSHYDFTVIHDKTTLLVSSTGNKLSLIDLTRP